MYVLTRGEYRDDKGTYGVLLTHTKQEVEAVLVTAGQVSSAYKQCGGDEFSFLNKKSKELWRIIHAGLKSCTAKNGVAVPFVTGTSVRHEFIKSKVEYCIETYNGEICFASAKGESLYIYMEHCDNKALMPAGIPYIKLSRAASEFNISGNTDDIVVRTVAEIALEKEDITWLRGKKYYIVNDDEKAEEIFNYLDNYNGVVAYDTETTGLKINCFGKINSSYQKDLVKWNVEHPEDKMRADRLVGLIYCVENDVSYYFPAFNRKFKNLYDDPGSAVRKRTTDTIKARYMVGDLRLRVSDMSDYIRNTPAEEWTSDIILMERNRNILETKHIVAHNGAFEWKVGWQYEVDTNLKDDTMLLHQIMYKFRSTTSNRGEPSNLKYLAKLELGIEQWGLKDFFPDFKEDKGGEVRSKKDAKGAKGKKAKKDAKSSVRIDFSYMDYEGTRIYAPTDGDVTYQLFMRYKKDLVTNHKEQEYLYNVEVLAACAIAYMEFYGHRLDEKKINAVRDQTRAKLSLIESEVRQAISYSKKVELDLYAELKDLVERAVEADKNDDETVAKQIHDNLLETVEKLENAIAADTESVLNLGSPAQVAKLFYEDLEIPFTGDKKSVAKKEIKPLLKAKNEDGTNKYPIVHLYSEYKNYDTLMTKFFDNLPYFMYPGGYVFSSFGQITTATGRMSCSKPNAQQYPKAVTGIVVPRPGYVMGDADYSQIEYRVLVALSGEKFLADLFEDPDNDYHTLMASLMYGVPYASVTPKMRGDAKSFNFGIPYGMGFKSLAVLLTGKCGHSEVEEAKEKYELYFKDQPKTRKFFDQIKEMAQVNKYTKTFWNRYRFYSFDDKDGNHSDFKKAMALRQAGNAVIQGTAADIFKISVARNFMYIRQNNLLGLLLITNLIHDEMLFEINSQVLNVQRVLRDIGENMQFKVQGFPPLFIGAGLASTWAKAKGKMAEIHPHLLDELSAEAENMPIFSSQPQDPKDVLKYFDDRVYNFRINKVKNYLLNSDNFGKELHPAVGSLLNLQFNYGHDKDKEGIKDDEFTVLCLNEFIKANNLNVTPELFKAQAENLVDIEEETGYEDEEEGVEEEEDFGYGDTDFALIDESSSLYGSSVHDLIRIFGFVASKSLRTCGVDTRALGYRQKDNLIDYLESHVCDEGELGSMQIVFLQDANILNNTGIWVKDIEGSELETRIKMMHTTSQDFGGIVNERLKG